MRRPFVCDLCRMSIEESPWRRRPGIATVRWLVVLASVLASLLAYSPTVAAAAVKPGQDHACVVGSPPAHGVDWSILRNPVLTFPTVGVKDQALQWSGGSWHMLYSDMVETASRPHVRFSVAVSSSPDLRHWTSPRIIASNAASPDIVRGPSGEFIVTYQTPDGLAYRTSSDASLTSWSRAHSLGPGLAGRMIDAALAFTGHGVILGFKAGTTTQHFEIAWAPTLTGRFRLVGRPNITVYNDTVENYEFVTVRGGWDLVATSNTLDQPFIFTLSPGNPSTPATWLHWGVGRELVLPSQPFNTGNGISSVGYEHANSAFLCVGPQGEYYLTYAASTELTRFGGWGHARIGIARSTNLVTWQAAPD
jgi:hypothetical protein